MSSTGQVHVVENSTCTFCGCVCDDIELHAEGDRITKAKNACSLGKAWFLNHTAEKLYPEALVDGKSATLDVAIQTGGGLFVRGEHAAGLRLEQHHVRSAA